MGKRANGEGSVYKRDDGLWVGAVTLQHGRRKVVYGRTRAEASAKLTTVLKTANDGLPVPTERQTLGQYLNHWLENSVKPSVRPRTYDSYAELVRLHISPALGNVRLQQLGPQHIQGFLNQKSAEGLSASTVKYLRAVLHRALDQAFKWSMVPRNVAALVSPPRIERQEVCPFDPEQSRAFLEAVKGNRLEALYTVAIAVGLRQGEALGLKWEDIGLETGVIRVRMQLQRIDGKYQLVEPKTTRSRRTIGLPAFAVNALHAHRARQLAEKLQAGGDWVETGLVFTTLRGTPLDAKNVTHRFQALLARVGLPRMRFHDLRHACATLLLAQGIHPRVIMETLGHSQIAMTMNVYSHVMPALQREAADKMDAILGAQK